VEETRARIRHGCCTAITVVRYRVFARSENDQCPYQLQQQQKALLRRRVVVNDAIGFRWRDGTPLHRLSAHDGFMWRFGCC